MYQFKTNIDENEYRAFLAENAYHSFMQLPEWAKVKDNWENELCGLFDGEKQVGGALLLIRKLPLGKCIIYSPHGFVIDYADTEKLKAFLAGLKKYAKSINAISVKFDPLVPNRNIEGQETMIDFGNDFDLTIKNLTDLGCIHHGFGKEMGDYFQPRFNMAIPLFNGNGPIDKKALLKTFAKGARSYIGNYHKNRGVYFECTSSADSLPEFVRLLSFTEQRQNIHLRNEEYFKKIMDAYGDRAKIYFAKINLPTYIDYLQKSIDKGENAEKNQALMEEAQKVLAARGETVALSTGLVILPRKEEQIKIAEYLYAGADTSIFPNLSTPNGVVYVSACDALDLGCDYYNLGGIDGDLASPLAIFKKKFSPHIFEFVGEFDLAIDRAFYFGFEKLLPQAKKIIKKIKK